MAKNTDHDGEDEFVPPTDGSWIPVDRLNQVLDQVRDLKDEVSTLRKPEEKTVSREEILRAVEDGDMTQVEADTLFKNEITKDVLSGVQNLLQTRDREASNEAILISYQESVPDLGKVGTDLNTRLSNEYNYMIGLGSPDNSATMVAAIRSVAGPLDIVRAKGRLKLEADEGGGGGADDEGEDKKSLTKRQKEHYTAAIKAGAYLNWDEVHKELGLG